jgi:hypothetical protein
MSHYKTPTCFGTEVPSSGSQTSYYVALAEIIKILNIKILKYIKLTSIKSQCFNVKSIKNIKSKPFQV